MRFQARAGGRARSRPGLSQSPRPKLGPGPSWVRAQARPKLGLVQVKGTSQVRQRYGKGTVNQPKPNKSFQIHIIFIYIYKALDSPIGLIAQVWGLGHTILYLIRA